MKFILQGLILWLSAFVAGCRPVEQRTTPAVRNEFPPETRQARGEEVGRRLADLRPGMTQAEVEVILGPPDIGLRSNLDGETASTTYYCSPPNERPGVHLMTMDFNVQVNPPILLEVSGPHLPY